MWYNVPSTRNVYASIYFFHEHSSFRRGCGHIYVRFHYAGGGGAETSESHQWWWEAEFTDEMKAGPENAHAGIGMGRASRHRRISHHSV